MEGIYVSQDLGAVEAMTARTKFGEGRSPKSAVRPCSIRADRRDTRGAAKLVPQS